MIHKNLFFKLLSSSLFDLLYRFVKYILDIFINNNCHRLY